MTMLSFRVNDEEAAIAQQWATRLGVDRSELLREALHRHLVRLRAEVDIEAWQASPLTDDELAIGQAAVQVEQAKQADSSSPFGILCISLRNFGSSFVISIGSTRTSGGLCFSSVSAMKDEPPIL